MNNLIKINLPVQSELILKTYRVPNKEGGMTEENVKTIISNPEYFAIKEKYLTMIQSYREKMEDQFIGGMPIQLEKDCLKQLFRINPTTNQLAYSMTLKVDGERFLLFVEKSILYFIDRSTNFFYIQGDERISIPGAKQPFLLDGELIQHLDGSYEYLIFDCLFYPDKQGTLKTWVYDPFTTRYLVSKEAVANINKHLNTTSFSCSLKKWFPITDIISQKDVYRYISTVTNKERSKNTQLVSDGLILQPNDTAYVTFREWNTYNNVQFKWKPSDQLTIDFKIKFYKPSEWHLYTGTDQQFMINQGPKEDPAPAVCYPTKKQLTEYQDGDVVEFILSPKSNPHKNIFIPIRTRNEKKSNSYQTIMSTLNVIQNAFNLDYLQEPLSIITSAQLFTPKGLSKLLNYYSKSDLIIFSVKTFFNDSEISEIRKIYDLYTIEYSSNFELEFRIFTGGKKNVSMNKSTFFYLHDYFWRTFPMIYDNTIDIYLNKPEDKKKYRSTYLNINDIYSKKSIENTTKYSLKKYTQKENVDKLYNGLIFRVDLSTEIDTAHHIGLESHIKGQRVDNMIRIKTRKTFQVNELWKVDFTRIRTSYSIKDILEKNETFECECEYTGGPDISFEDFLKSINDLYRLILSNSGYC